MSAVPLRSVMATGRRTLSSKFTCERIRLRPQNDKKVVRSLISAILAVPNAGTSTLLSDISSQPRFLEADAHADAGTLQDKSTASINTSQAVILSVDTAEGVRLALSRTGDIALWESSSGLGTGRLVAQASLHLPPNCYGKQPNVLKQTKSNGRLVDAILAWGDASSPDAELHITALNESKDPSIPIEQWAGVSQKELLD